MTNSFYKKDCYYVLTIKTKGTVYEEYFNGEDLEILFDGSEEVVKSIMNSSWCLSNEGNQSFYILTTNYNKTGKAIKLHQAVFGKIPKGYVINHINRAEGSWRDNRLSNLEETSIKQNSRNRVGAGYPLKRKAGWLYQITLNGCSITTPTKQDYDEVDLDALIVQEHFNYTHRQNEWYKTKNVSQEYKDNLINLIEQKLEKKRNKKPVFDINKWEFFNEDSLKIFDSKQNFCIISKNSSYILELGRISKSSSKYWVIRIGRNVYPLHRYLLGIREVCDYTIQVDHLNQNTNDNRLENLVITTSEGNLSNKKSKGYTLETKYRVQYRGYWRYISKHKEVNKNPRPCFKTEIEAKEEVFKRKWLANYIRPQFKTYQEYLIFKEEYELNNINNLSIDDYWIITRFPDISNIKIK